ncbi:hypothetical protein GCM10009092_01450 [Bowmanella denitrificans]|uniref:YvrJ family protein n=1 Tax=Bowmanella denitrificans TaxID=366582 RepID=A0ABN0WKT8_9ALTE|nr:hypothetical protein [Bowmanella denitrificans]
MESQAMLGAFSYIVVALFQLFTPLLLIYIIVRLRNISDQLRTLEDKIKKQG